MAALTIKKAGMPYSEINLVEGRSYLAGRKPDCDIPLDAEKAISREHLKIKLENGNLHVECLSKLANLTTSGVPVMTVDLQTGGQFSVGPFDFQFSTVVDNQHLSQPSSAISEVISMDDKTVIQKTTLSAVVKLLSPDGDLLHLFRLEGKDSWTAGRDVSAEILINDHRVSRKQFEVRKINNYYEIIDAGSVNGTFVNEKLLENQSPVVLRSGDVIRVLDHQLIFEMHDPQFTAKVENLAPMVIDNNDAFSDEQVEFAEEEQLQEPEISHDFAPMEDGKAAKEKKLKIAIGVGVVLIALFYVFAGDGSSSSAPSSKAPAAADPLSALSAQQKSEYRQSLELSKRYFMEGNYSLSLSEVEDLIKTYSVTDPEAEKLKNTAIAAIETQKQLLKQEKEEKERQVMEAKISVATVECGNQLQRFNSEEELDQCLLEVLQLNPSHPAILNVKTQFQSLEADRMVKKQQQADYANRAQQLRNLHEKAQKIEKEGDYIATLQAYQNVINSNLPDPGGLKNSSKNYIKKLKDEMARKIKKYESDAAQAKSAGQLKQAVLTLRMAIEIDPTRDDLKESAEEVKNELRKQMMVYYQEGILEESFGNVEGGDNRAGAKEKWKKIIETDLPDGEYYKKAFIKLKKYGAQ